MSGLGLSFHHLGLAVRNPGEALRFVGGLGYQAGTAVFDPEQNVNLIMCTHPVAPQIEIISPGSGPGPVDVLLKRHASGIVYHLCYVAESVEASLAAMENANLRPVCVSPSKPSVLFGGRLVSFYQVMGMGIIELIDGRR